MTDSFSNAFFYPASTLGLFRLHIDTKEMQTSDTLATIREYTHYRKIRNNVRRTSS